MRLIDADALLKRLETIEPRSENMYHEQGIRDGLHHYMPMILNEAPTIDAEPIRCGKWIRTEDEYYNWTIFKCSECKGEWVFEIDEDIKELDYNYCPNCGAKMEEE